MGEGLLTGQHEHGVEFSIAYPDGWEQIEGALGTELALVAPGDPTSEFRTNVNLVVDRPDPPLDIDAVRAQHASSLASALNDPRVLDEDTVSVGGHAASRVLVAYTLQGEDLTLEQWIVPVSGRHFVLSATVETVDYASQVADFQEIVESVSFGV